MSRFRSKKTWKRGKRYGRKKSTFGKKLLRQAKKPGVQSAAEMAIKIIAKKEAEKLTPPNLIFRQMIWADYNRLTNHMDGFTRIGWAGLTLLMPRIPIMDNPVRPMADPNSVQPQVLDNQLRPQLNPAIYGTNAVAPFQFGRDGYRSGSKVQIKNIAFGIRCRNDPFGYSEANLPEYEHAFIKWAVVCVKQDGSLAAGAKPLPDRVLRMRTFGFSSRLDVGEDLQTEHFKFKTVMKGTIKLGYSSDHVVETQREYFKEVNIPIEYAANDVFGEQQIGRNALYLVVRSTIPDPVGQADKDWRPEIGGYYKLGYKNTA